MLAERQERIAEVEAEIDGLLARLLMLRKMPQRDQRLLEAPYRLPVGRARGGLVTGLTEVREGLSPHLASEGMVREGFNLFIHMVGIQPFEGLDNPGVEGAPMLQEKTSIGHLLCE